MVNPKLLQEVEVPVPSPKAGQVLMQVAGSAFNPADWKLLESPLSLTWSIPHIFGRDYAGTVVAVGQGVDSLKVNAKAHKRFAVANSKCGARASGVQEHAGY